MKKVHSQLCQLHDDKAISILKELCSSIDDATECLVIHLRQIEMHSLCADGKCDFLWKIIQFIDLILFRFFVDFSKVQTRIECLRLSLSYAFSSKFIFELYVNEVENLTDVIEERMELFEKLLQTILKKAIKVTMLKSVAANATNYFKSIYTLTLRKPEKLSRLQMAEHLVKVLDKMGNITEEAPWTHQEKKML